MSLVIGLWAMTALAVIVGRARRGSWRTVRRYQAGQRALARLGRKEAPREDDGDGLPAPGGPDLDDDPLPHVRLLKADHLPPPRPASYAGPRSIGSWRPGWARADDFDARPSVSIDTRTWSHELADPDAGSDLAPAPSPAPRRLRPLPGAVSPDTARAPARTMVRSTDADALTMASFIRVAAPRSRRPRWVQPAPRGPRPAKALVGAAAAVLALLATGAAATMHPRPTEASVTARRAATTHPAPPSSVAAPHRAASVPTAVPRAQVTGDAHAATVIAPTGSMVQLAAMAPCWVEVRAGSSGPVIAESTLAPGQTASFPLQDGLWIRLGDPGAATLSIDGRVVTLPSQAGQPIDVSFSRHSG